jgi:hypothetical protein
MIAAMDNFLLGAKFCLQRIKKTRPRPMGESFFQQSLATEA